MEKLIAGIMGQDCIKFLPMCIESLKTADRIVYIDGGSKDNSVEYAKEQGCEIIVNKYNQADHGMNGKQRNIFLQYLKKNYPEEWCIFVDADEVVEDLNKIKEFIQTAEQGLYSVKMRHFIGDLGHEDATRQIHLVPHRLFKIKCADKYPEQEHPVLTSKAGIPCHPTDCTTIWHLAYIPNIWDIKRRYENHLKKSKIHSRQFLRQWYKAHLFGEYPKAEINKEEIPEIILKEFLLSKDEIYFEKRGLELKHFIDAIHWKEFFKSETATLYGCGRGPRVFALKEMGIDAMGIEISEYAIENSICGKERIRKGDIRKDVHEADLIIAYDVLEHLSSAAYLL